MSSITVYVLGTSMIYGCVTLITELSQKSVEPVSALELSYQRTLKYHRVCVAYDHIVPSYRTNISYQYIVPSYRTIISYHHIVPSYRTNYSVHKPVNMSKHSITHTKKVACKHTKCKRL
jgi:hypothetical protein